MTYNNLIYYIIKENFRKIIILLKLTNFNFHLILLDNLSQILNLSLSSFISFSNHPLFAMDSLFFFFSWCSLWWEMKAHALNGFVCRWRLSGRYGGGLLAGTQKTPEWRRFLWYLIYFIPFSLIYFFLLLIYYFLVYKRSPMMRIGFCVV